ncbi:MAG: N-glycosylase/DNA lyase [Nanoarchaeota archaeon]
MKTLVKRMQELKDSRIKYTISSKMKEFKNNGQDNKTLFSELCFCILTANFNAERSIKIQNKLKNKFSSFSEQVLAEKLKENGHRFPNARAKYICSCRIYKNNLKEIINSFSEGKKAREWLLKNIMGMGMKESSHFLRNVGFTDVAIIDFHIIDILVKSSVIERPKILSKQKYLEIEKNLEKMALKLNLNLGELDLYLWYLETGKILK